MGDDRLAAVFFHFVTPAALLRLGLRACIQECGGQISGVFAGMIEVKDLLGIGEVDAGVFPNPRRSISEINGALGGSQATAQRFGSQETSDMATVFKCANVCGGIGVAHGQSFFISGGLGEDTAEFGFAGACGAVGLFAFDVNQLATPERDAGAIAGDVEDGNVDRPGSRGQGGLCGKQSGSYFSN